MKRIFVIVLCLTAVAFGISTKYIQPQFSTKGLVAHYKLCVAPMTVGSVFDYALNGNTGTITDSDSPITLRPAYPGFEFDGANDYIDIGKGATIQNLNDFTISVWVFSTNIGSVDKILTQVTGAISDGEVDFGFIGGDKVRMRADTLISILSSVLEENTWYHLAVVVIADDNAKLYIDGNEDADDSSIGTTAPYFHAAPNVIIGATSTPGSFFAGKIDDIRIYDRALSAADVLSIYLITKHRYQK